jgi:hypothetical protein
MCGLLSWWFQISQDIGGWGAICSSPMKVVYWVAIMFTWCGFLGMPQLQVYVCVCSYELVFWV